MHSPRPDDLTEFLSSVYNAKITDPGKIFSVTFNRGESVGQIPCYLINEIFIVFFFFADVRCRNTEAVPVA